MEYPLLTLLILASFFHCFILRISIYILLADGVNVMNKALAAILCSIISQMILGDCLLIYSAVFASYTDNIYFLTGISDCCTMLLFQTIYATYMQYRSVLLYKGYAKRFYDFSLNALIYKTILTPMLGIFGLILSQLWNFNVMAFMTINQTVVAFSNFIYFSVLRRKFEEMNNRFIVRTTGTTSTINQAAIQPSSTAKEQYEATKKEIHRNMGITLVSMAIFVVIAGVLLGIFHQFDHRSGYYISLSYRMVISLMIALLLPIYKKRLEQIKQDRLMHQSQHHSGVLVRSSNNNNSRKNMVDDDED